METNKVYKIELRISHPQITSLIEGVIFNQTEDKLPHIEPHYYTANLDNETEDIIVKVVNMQHKGITTEIELMQLDSIMKSAKIESLEGYKKTDKNSFEEPTKVVPSTKTILLTDENSLTYSFPAESNTFIRFQK